MPSASERSETGLATFLKLKRQELIDRWSRETKLQNTADPVSRAELLDHIPRFVDELVAALYPEAVPLPSEASIALEHGAQRLRLGFNVAEVVREYGALHRCIIELAGEAEEPISPRDQVVIAKWLNAGIANAASQYVIDRDTELQRQAAEHLGFIAHEIRNPLSSVSMAFRLLRKGALAQGGRAVDLFERNLRRTVDVIDNALHHAALNMGVAPRLETLTVATILKELESDWSAEAEAKGIQVDVEAQDGLAIKADPRLLNSALSNLLQNALKFSHANGTIRLRARRTDLHMLLEVEDACGGLPPGRADELFEPLVKRGLDQSGFGLGLAIAQQAAQAHRGTLTVRDLPGRGCIFTLQLPAP
jgi:signal transduction histidine kinase